MESTGMKWRREGRAEGRASAQAQLLTSQLTARFGPLPDELEARIAAADAETAKLWALRLLTATDLEEVFAEAPPFE